MRRAGERSAVPSCGPLSAKGGADLFGQLIHAACRFLEDGWRHDLSEFLFVLDGKLPGKLAAGEKQLDTLLLPRLQQRLRARRSD
jgi:hypothetical protein